MHPISDVSRAAVGAFALFFLVWNPCKFFFVPKNSSFRPGMRTFFSSDRFFGIENLILSLWFRVFFPSSSFKIFFFPRSFFSLFYPWLGSIFDLFNSPDLFVRSFFKRPTMQQPVDLFFSQPFPATQSLLLVYCIGI